MTWGHNPNGNVLNISTFRIAIDQRIVVVPGGSRDGDRSSWRALLSAFVER